MYNGTNFNICQNKTTATFGATQDVGYYIRIAFPNVNGDSLWSFRINHDM